MIPLYDRDRGEHTPWFTWLVILVCAVTFVYQCALDPALETRLLYAGGIIPVRFTQTLDAGIDRAAVANLTTVVTALFLHSTWLHLLGNMWFLHVFGDNVEKRMGGPSFAVFFFVCSVGAAMAQWAAVPDGRVPAIGASGAVAGVLAAYPVLFPRAKIVTFVPVLVFGPVVEMPMLFVVTAWLIPQLTMSVLAAPSAGGVAWPAHLGGFATGLVLAFAWRMREARMDAAGTNPTLPARLST